MQPAPWARGGGASIAPATQTQSSICSRRWIDSWVPAVCNLALRCSRTESIVPPAGHRGLELNGEQKLARMDNAPYVLWRECGGAWNARGVCLPAPRGKICEEGLQDGIPRLLGQLL